MIFTLSCYKYIYVCIKLNYILLKSKGLKSLFKKVFVVFLSFFLVGCTPIFIQQDKPIILNNSTGQQETQNRNDDNIDVTIKNINNNLTDGLVYDMSKDGKNLLVGNLSSAISGDINSVSSSLNLHTFDVKKSELKQLLISNNEQINAMFDPVSDGVFYTEYKLGPDGKPLLNSYTLNWTNTDGSITKNVSRANESVSENFYISDNILIYGNTKGVIKLINTDTLKDVNIYAQSFQLDEGFTGSIKKIQYHKDLNRAYILIKDIKTENYDLYSVQLDQYKVQPLLLSKNVSDFEIGEKSNGILYCVKGDKNKLIYVEMLSLVPEEKVLYQGYINLFSFSPDENSIIFSEKLDRTSNSENLWFINRDGNELKQVASNLKIAGSHILFAPNKNIIYFSIYNIENDNPNSYTYKVYMIEYS